MSGNKLKSHGRTASARRCGEVMGEWRIVNEPQQAQFVRTNDLAGCRSLTIDH
jgi:hypothetical protein